MKKLKVMADYECFPIWDMSPEKYGDVDPNVLPISDELKQQLFDWSNEYDGTMNHSDPASSGFKSREVEMAFKERGVKLAHQLQKELGPNYKVLIK